MKLLAEISTLQKTIGEQTQRGENLYAAQERIRQNLGALQHSGDEGKLRGQYVQRLAATETELADIAQKIEGLKAQIKEKEAQIEQVIAGLSQ